MIESGPFEKSLVCGNITGYDKPAPCNRSVYGAAGALDFPALGAPGNWFDPERLLMNPRAFFRVFLGEHCSCGFNVMHEVSFAEYRTQIAAGDLRNRTGRRLAIAAPRGAAKSTVHTMLFPIMDILSGRERHQVIISGTMQQAKNRIATITRELRGNAAIRDAFFGGRMPKFKSNTRSIEIGNCRIEAFSAGSEMRGISHGEFRPTRIILDDVELSVKVGKASHRRKLLTWYDEIVENLGDSYTHITIVGTILHTDSLLSTLLNRPGFKSEFYKSIIAWDNRPDLWRGWQKLFTDRSDPDSVEKADAYFAENAQAMLEGTEVFWPEKEPYVKLQEKLLVLGRAAFFKEKQNSPIKDGDQIFDTSLWTQFIVDDGLIQMVPRTVTLEQEKAMAGEAGEAVAWGDRLNTSDRSDRSHKSNNKTRTDDLKYFGFLDPALGKSTTRDGDYAAIVTVGKGPDNTLYVVDVWMEKASPMRQVEQVFALHAKYKYQKFGFESNGFQETLGKFIRDKQAELKRARGHWYLPIGKYNNLHNKHSRISLLEPHIIAGSIMFHQDLKQEFYVQADEYNGNRSTHDDGLDALASCVEMIRGIEKPIMQIRSIKGRHPARGF